MAELEIGSAPAPVAAVETAIPARLDRLPWSRFHWLVVTALGITWLLDGLEVTLAGSVASALRQSPSLHLTNEEVGASATAYILGAVLGALGFGWLTDRWGRKRLFSITLTLYLLATAATAFSWNLTSFLLFRFLTGAGIGGEATAINSAIQELIPARYRGWTDLTIQGSYWLGAALGAVGTLVLLDPARLPPDVGWRAAFGIGAALGLVIVLLRRFLPESPRWLMVHGRTAEADVIVGQIEARVIRETGQALPEPTGGLRLTGVGRTSFRLVAHTLFTTYRNRTILGLALIASQAFFYNAIFFTYALVLSQFYGVPAAHIGWYMLPFAIGNFFGPFLLGRLFDSLGRRTMITATYAISGVLLAGAAILFGRGVLDATTQTIAWTIVFFFASAAASSAYLTVSECFPLEIRALAIAFFYAIGTLLGGAAAPWVFGRLIESGERQQIVWGYFFGAALMIGAALVALFLSVKAERCPLETVAPPLSTVRGTDERGLS